MRQLGRWLALAVSISLAPCAAAATFATALRGLEELPNPGALEGSGLATVSVVESGVEWAIYVTGIGAPTGAEIRKGRPGQQGTTAVFLGVPHPFNGFASGVAETSPAVRDDIFAHPDDYY